MGTPVVAADEPSADKGVVGDGDGDGGDGDGDGAGDAVGVGRGDSVTVGVAVGDGLGEAVGVGGVDSVTVGLAAGVSGPTGDRVELGIVAVGVSGRIGDRVGLGIVAVGVGKALAEGSSVTDGRSGEPPAPHELNSRVMATVRPAACVHEWQRCGTVESGGRHLMRNSYGEA